MYKVYIADDETIIRNGLISGLNWEELNCRVVGSAPDGKKAYDDVLQLRPDILLTDIKMPFLDGLDMISLLRQKMPELYIVVITGYNEFSFAQRAVKLGVYDFILKPIDLDYLCKIILDIGNKIKSYRSGLNQSSRFKGKISISASQALWNSLFSPTAAVPENFKEISLPVCLCVIVQIDDYFRIIENMTLEEQKTADESICECIIRPLRDFENIYVLARGNAQFLFVFFSENTSQLKSVCQKIIHTIRFLLDRQLNCTATCGIGTILQDSSLIRQSYLEAEEALQHRFLYGSSSDIYFSTLRDCAKMPDYDSVSDLQTLVSSIASGLSDQAIDEAEKMISFLHHSLHTPVNKLVVNNILLGCAELLSAVNLSLYEIIPDFSVQYKKLTSFDSDTAIRNGLASIIRQVSNIYNLAKENLTSSENPIVSEAKDYIEAHYSDCGLSLNKVADALSVSSCYLSNLFKQDTQKTYIDYLTSIRIKKAKELLSDPQVKIYEVCYLVGYDNPTYFSTLFKKRTGFTPTEYRNHLRSAPPIS